MAGAFQSDAFQNNAFQVDAAPVVSAPTGSAGRRQRIRFRTETPPTPPRARVIPPIVGYGGVRFSGPTLAGIGDVNDDELAIEMLLTT